LQRRKDVPLAIAEVRSDSDVELVHEERFFSQNGVRARRSVT
jgi:hypothetical protein